MLACQAAISRQGPAILIVPVDISNTEIKDEVKYSLHFPKPVRRPSDDELRQTVSILNEGKKIGIYAGAGCEGAHDLLIALAKKLKAPIAHTSRAKDFVEYDNPYNVGMTGLLGVHSGFHMMTECDTLLLLGADFAWGQFYPQHAKIVQIDRDASRLGRRHPVTLGLEGDILASLEALLPILQEHSDETFLKECLEERKKTEVTLLAEEHIGDGSVIHPQYLASLLNKYADDDALFAADTGTSWVWILRHLKVNGKRRTMMSLRHGTMANGMPMALGLKKAFPERQVICMSGDGGLAMLMGNASKILQTVAANIDRDIFDPLLSSLYDMIMLTDDSGLLSGDETIKIMGVTVAIQRETQRSRQLEFLQITANPIDNAIIGPKGRASVLRTVADTIGMDGEDIVPSEDQLNAMQQQAAQQAEQQAQMGAQAQGGQNKTGATGDMGPRTNLSQGA